MDTITTGSFSIWGIEVGTKEFFAAVDTILLMIVILVATFVAARLVVRLLTRLLDRDGSRLQAVSIFTNLARTVIWIIGLCVMLGTCFDVDVTGIIAALGVTGIAISLGLQDTISNISGGLQLSLMGTVKVGDFVRIGSVEGVVEDIQWRHTIIKGFAGETMVIPNSITNNTTLMVLPPVQKVKAGVCVPFEALAAYEGAGGTLNDMIADMSRAVEHALTDPEPAGMGLKLSQEVYVRFGRTNEYAHEMQIIAWVAPELEFDRTKAIDVMVRAAAPYCTLGREGATVPA